MSAYSKVTIYQSFFAIGVSSRPKLQKRGRLPELFESPALSFCRYYSLPKVSCLVSAARLEVASPSFWLQLSVGLYLITLSNSLQFHLLLPYPSHLQLLWHRPSSYGDSSFFPILGHGRNLGHYNTSLEFLFYLFWYFALLKGLFD